MPATRSTSSLTARRQIQRGRAPQGVPSEQATHGDIRQGFVYERVPHVTLRSIANNAEIDVIWEKSQEIAGAVASELNAALKKQWEEWEIPREAATGMVDESCEEIHAAWWEARMARQREIDASIAAKAENEYLYDKPYEDRKKVRVAGPFTVEHCHLIASLGVDENDELIELARWTRSDRLRRCAATSRPMILDNLKTAGVQQAAQVRQDRLYRHQAWPGTFICAEGRYMEGDQRKKASRYLHRS